MKVVKNYLYNAGYQVLLMLVPLITVPYISRVLGAYNSGVNSYTNSLVTFFYLTGQLGITLYGNRQIAYYQNNKFNRSVEFWSIVTLQLITSSFAFILYMVIIPFLRSNFQIYYFFQSLWIVATGIDISWYFMGIEDFKKTVLRNTIVKIITVTLIFLLIKGPSDLGLYIILLGIAQVGGNVTLWPYLKHSIVKVPFKLVKPFKHFHPTLMLFIPTITSQIYLVINRLMLGSMSTQVELGKFDYSDKIVKLVLAIVTATGSVMLPHIASKYANKDFRGINASLYSSFDFVTALSVPLMFGLAAIAIKFTPWFLGAEYVKTGYIIICESPIIVIISWSVVSGMQYLVPTNHVYEYTFSIITGAVVNVIANLVLIKFLNAIGAAIATVISELVITVVELFFMRKLVKINYIFDGLWKYFVSGFIMFIVVNFLNATLKFNIVTLIIEVIIGVILYLLLLILFKAEIIDKAKEVLVAKRL
ncbi:polysaccharide biosynthesis C-terminal domain-containing protein [Limosilactobacillus agrestimuris]|uniref:oligosaccharide flippase family protein n=1 Tax=Limosilactobacillus agrestimuris TaxID=2941331 RepID=UPI00203BA442|nr:polysaccharide biosynthesis C-terminal domain-containing protein [Limosilactobacillus agrestimuris]